MNVPYYPYFSFVQRPFEMRPEHLRLLDQAVTLPSPAVDSTVGRIGQLACYEHFNALAQYALIADGEQIRSIMFPGSFGGTLFAQQTEISVRNHALGSGAFVVNATGWLDADQQAQIMAHTGSPIGPISGGHFTAVIPPQREYLGEPLRSGEGEGEVIADLDLSLINTRKVLMDASGHYTRPELLSLLVDRTPSAHLHDRFEHHASVDCEEADYEHV
jgi:nitrilase